MCAVKRHEWRIREEERIIVIYIPAKFDNYNIQSV